MKQFRVVGAEHVRRVALRVFANRFGIVASYLFARSLLADFPVSGLGKEHKGRFEPLRRAFCLFVLEFGWFFRHGRSFFCIACC